MNAKSTILGDGALPVGGEYRDLNRSPATSVELRFRNVILDGKNTGFDHAYIVVTDNQTGTQTVHQASPRGPQGNNWFPLPMGTIDASTEPYGPASTGYGQPYRKVASFNTDASAGSVSQSLDNFGTTFNKKSIPYALPDIRIPFVPPTRHPSVPTRNSNYYGGAAWGF
jgi:hypothetical protein